MVVLDADAEPIRFRLPKLELDEIVEFDARVEIARFHLADRERRTHGFQHREALFALFFIPLALSPAFLAKRLGNILEGPVRTLLHEGVGEVALILELVHFANADRATVDFDDGPATASAEPIGDLVGQVAAHAGAENEA